VLQSPRSEPRDEPAPFRQPVILEEVTGSEDTRIGEQVVILGDENSAPTEKKAVRQEMNFAGPFPDPVPDLEVSGRRDLERETKGKGSFLGILAPSPVSVLSQAGEPRPSRSWIWFSESQTSAPRRARSSRGSRESRSFGGVEEAAGEVVRFVRVEHWHVSPVIVASIATRNRNRSGHEANRIIEQSKGGFRMGRV